MAQAPSSSDHDHRLVIEPRPYNHPDVQLLTAQLHQEQLSRYGFADAPDEPVSDFTPPTGLFLVAYVDTVACACGGVRTHEPGIAEIKKMYVAPGHRGHGLGWQILTGLELVARSNRAHRIILETGSRNTEALALYTRAGYRPIPAYRERDASINRALAKDLRPT